MRHLILSDIHGNWDALSTVLDSVRDEPFDSVLVLGDLVGYGASPHRIIDRVRRFGPELTIVRGNHDKVVAGLEEGLGFNSVALASIRWTRSRLGKRRLAYLRDLQQGPAQVEDFLLCHGSPADEDLYILNEESAMRAFADTEFSLAFFGHTHVPCVIGERADGIEWQDLVPGVTLELPANKRYLVNVGSVGQPRDRDPRAAFVVYDSVKRLVEIRRVAYPVERAQRRIVRAGLPSLLADRLAIGM